MRTCLMLLLLSAAPASAAGPFFLKDGQRVLFVGDSNTYADLYIHYLDAYLFTRFPGQRFELLGRGMPSETVAGTSEPTHDPPRPDFHTRFSRTVPPLKPDVLVACYGMNDGVYRSFDEEIFAQYKAGIVRLVKRTTDETGAQLVLMTPPPFDPTPFTDKPIPKVFDYRRPAPDYDKTLARFSAWLRSTPFKDTPVIDLNGPLTAVLAARRKDDPKFVLAPDGIHPTETGHALIALTILKAWHAPAIAAAGKADAKALTVSGAAAALKRDGDAFELTWTAPLPMPLDPRWDRRTLEMAKFAEALNVYRLTVTNLPSVKYELQADGKAVATVTAKELADGLDLSRFAAFAPVREAADVLQLVQARRRALHESWVMADPHPRLTDIRASLRRTSKATPEDATRLEAEIRKRCLPRAMKLRLVPAG